MNSQKTGSVTCYVAMLGFLLLLPGAAQANLLLVFAVEETRMTKNETPQTINSKLNVDIGSDYFSYENAEEKVIFDFEKRRIYSIKPAQKTYRDDSLFINIGFRSYEFQNRLFLGGAMERAGIKDNPMAVTMSEHIFAISRQDHKPEIERKKAKGEVAFLWQGKKLLGYSLERLKVDAEHRKGFLRFFRYYQSGHPQILLELSKLKGIPSRFEIYKSNVSEEITVLKLETHRVTPARKYDLTGLKKWEVEGELARLLPADRPYTPEALHTRAGEIISIADGAFAKKRYLDSMLAYMEYHLMTGEGMPAAFEAKREKLAQDENVMKLLASLNPKSEEEAKKGVETLRDLRKVSQSRQHILLIFEANVLRSLKEPAKARENFLAALAANPYIVGAWKDLGDIYLENFETREAWFCWDLARQLLPTHSMLQAVNEGEQKLVTTYPEFF